MNLVFLISSMLGVLIFADNDFRRVLLYVLILSGVVSGMSFQIGFYHGILILFFSSVCFPLIGYACITKTEKKEKNRNFFNILPSIFLLPFLFATSSFLPEMHEFYILILYSIICISFSKNLLRYFFIFGYLEDILLLLSSYLKPAPLLGIKMEIFVEFATILPLAILAFFTIMLYKENRSLSAWSIWR